MVAASLSGSERVEVPLHVFLCLTLSMQASLGVVSFKEAASLLVCSTLLCQPPEHSRRKAGYLYLHCNILRNTPNILKILYLCLEMLFFF